MIDRSTAQAIAQEWVDQHYNLKKPHLRSVPLTLRSALRLICFRIFHPLYYLTSAVTHLIDWLRCPSTAVVIVNERTIEEDFGWVFFYSMQRYLVTHHRAWSIVGGGPIIIDRCNGSVHGTGSARPVDHYIEKYRQQRTMNC
jgi:hypothetical protein